MRKDQYKAKLFEMIISGKDLQYVMDECSALLGNPYVFANQSLQLIGKSSSCNQYPEIFDWMEDQYGENLQIAKEASEAGYFKFIYSGDDPVYGKISAISSNWVAARVRLKNKVFGSILVADVQSPFTNDYEELVPLVCQTIAFALQQSGKQEYSGQNYSALLVELLDGVEDDFMNEEAVRKNFRLLGHDFPEKMRVLIVRSIDPEYTINKMVIDAQLHSQFPFSLGTLYKNDCIRIIDNKLSVETIEERLRKYIQTDYIICGISRSISSVLSLKDAYLQADAAIRLRKSARSELLVDFDSVSGLYLLEQAEGARAISANGMIMPEILELLGKKDSGAIERVLDLAAYMSCGRNVTRTAELRNVHKNSMYYRLDKIMDLTGLNLGDDDVCVQVTLSLLLLGYLPFIKSGEK
ncbi:MAG: helix-turn-helix domain-containing protein [Eubacteriales bacterium]|nr:helix-turn-helix domain-containing protein [Eubacteriales bacterium]